jgi:hypothetical protein
MMEMLTCMSCPDKKSTGPSPFSIFVIFLHENKLRDGYPIGFLQRKAKTLPQGFAEGLQVGGRNQQQELAVGKVLLGVEAAWCGAGTCGPRVDAATA